MMRAEAEMRGFCGKGKPDYVAIYKKFCVIVTEAKKADIEKALPQVIAEMATARYTTGEARQCHKRNFDELDVELPVSGGGWGCERRMAASLVGRTSAETEQSLGRWL